MKALSGIGLVLLAVLGGVLAWNLLDVAMGGPGLVERGLIPARAPLVSSAVSPAPSVPSSSSSENFGQKIARAARHALVYEVNGLLTLLYLLLDNAAAAAMLVLAAAAAALERHAPTAQRVFTVVVLLVSVLAAMAVPPPVPAILATMWLFPAVVQVLDPAGGRALSWRARSGILLYAGAGVLYTIYTRLVAGVAPEAWSALAGGVEEARAVMAQSRAYITTMANIALWFVMPVGYFSLMVQAALQHPFPRSPFMSVAERIRLIRTRGVE
ncbi:MAG: hypothetical protein ACP5N6_07595 [Anaerolineae bacterium]